MEIGGDHHEQSRTTPKKDVKNGKRASAIKKTMRVVSPPIRYFEVTAISHSAETTHAALRSA